MSYPRLSAIAGPGPYHAEPIGPNGWWIVVDRNGLNVGVWPSGVTVAGEQEAKAAAERFNG